jgi:hypothetical protein
MNTERLLVAICTHDPRPAFLAETLVALRAQTQPVSDWRLLIVDNASHEPLARNLDLAWHPAARVVREEKLGVAHARLRALHEARDCGESLLLFVDDDNILAEDYISRGLAMASASPRLGAWGGQLLARHETPPPAWIKRYENYLAIWSFSRETVTDHFVGYDAIPPTAGCFLRLAVAERYLELTVADPRRLLLGARGDVQLRGEDTDLVLTAYDLGLAVGRFPELKLTHIIPAGRLTAEYLAGLMHGTLLGFAMLEYIRFGRTPPPPAGNWLRQLIERSRIGRLPSHMRLIATAEFRARQDARRLVHAWRQDRPDAAQKPLLRPC